ncbi:hypothetical protein B0H14DRAFT_3608454 [Mycena olivaceomarginata]|nr:hypothetical protein B0H14DRAFT_3608454 [Mycena olivaceomarginata]
MRAPCSVLLEFMHMLNDGEWDAGQPLLSLAALNALIQLRCKYDCMNILAAAVGVYKPMQITPHRGLSSNLPVLAHKDGIAAALPAAYYRTLVAGNNNSLLLDGLTHQDGTRASLPPLGLCRCLIGRECLLAKQFQPGYTLGWLRTWPQSPTCGNAARWASPYSAASWTTTVLQGCTSSTRQGVRDALRCVRQGGGGGDGDQAQEGTGIL